MNEACFQYFRCDKPDCPAYNNTQKMCWEIENTLCNSPHFEVMLKHDRNKCEYCQYYKLNANKTPGGR